MSDTKTGPVVWIEEHEESRFSGEYATTHIGDYRVMVGWPGPIWFVMGPNGQMNKRSLLRRTSDGVITRTWDNAFNTRTYALTFAAHLAGIERQRVALFHRELIAAFGGPPLWFTYANDADEQPDESGHLSKLMDRAHEYARERYAALGGAAC